VPAADRHRIVAHRVGGNRARSSYFAPPSPVAEGARRVRRVDTPIRRPWRAGDEVAVHVQEILVMGLVAIAVVIVMAGVLGRLVAHDDLSTMEG
jgi:hypothetical protein